MTEAYFKKRLTQLQGTCKSTIQHYELSPSTSMIMMMDPLLPNEILLLQRNYFTPFITTFQFLHRHAPQLAHLIKVQYQSIMRNFFEMDLKGFAKKLLKTMVRTTLSVLLLCSFIFVKGTWCKTEDLNFLPAVNWDLRGSSSDGSPVDRTNILALVHQVASAPTLSNQVKVNPWIFFRWTISRISSFF